MDDDERLIGSEGGNEDGANINRGKNNTGEPQVLFTNEGVSDQPNADAFRPRPVVSLSGLHNHGGLAPPSHRQTTQMEPISTENEKSVPDEPPPEYSGPPPRYSDPPPGYNPTQSGGDRFLAETTMSTAEEQERANQVEDEIGRLVALSTAVQALEEREKQNSNALVGQNPAQGSGQNKGSVPVGITRIFDGPTPVAAAGALGGVQVLTNGSSINGSGMQPVRPGTDSYKDAKRMCEWCANYKFLLTFLGFIGILAVGIIIGVAHSASKNTDHSDHSHHSTGCSYFTCHNGGTCKTTGTKTYCNCSDGYQGTHCEERKCQKYCHNGGTCRIRNGESECHCPPGYKGIYCSEFSFVQPTSCDIPWCMNGGRCVETIFSVRCVCPVGTHGDRCQSATRKPPSCGDIVCENGGHCGIPYYNASPQCVCPEPYYGDHCQLVRATTTPRPN